MCDYCGCRNQPLIGRLSEEHIHLLDHLSSAERALARGDLEAARVDVSAVSTLLDGHMVLEETALFPALATDPSMEATLDALEADHAAVRVAPPEDQDRWVAWASELLSTVRAHIEVEETDVFPASIQVVSPAEWDDAEERAAALPGGLGNHHHRHPH